MKIGAFLWPKALAATRFTPSAPLIVHFIAIQLSGMVRLTKVTSSAQQTNPTPMEIDMKTNYKTSMKDNVATGLVLSAMFIFAFASIGTSFAKPAAHIEPAVQKMETIVVTAKRLAVYKMETIVVTAPRMNEQVASTKTPTAI
jgi:hypothetical protein